MLIKAKLNEASSRLLEHRFTAKEELERERQGNSALKEQKETLNETLEDIRRHTSMLGKCKKAPGHERKCRVVHRNIGDCTSFPSWRGIFQGNLTSGVAEANGSGYHSGNSLIFQRSLQPAKITFCKVRRLRWPRANWS